MREKIREVQKKMLEVTTLPTNSKTGKGLKTLPGSIFKDTMVPVEKLHFTLHVIHLKDEEEKEK